MVIEGAKSKFFRVGWQAGDPGEVMFQLQAEAVCWRILSYLGEAVFFT